ncbi:hypothetical protein C8J57DRAFT_1644685 [Mycena rebaudengoi]|nr:hypothetical protein C8J57DRAFT_1644685 [Mycena rebaudengoi]
MQAQRLGVFNGHARAHVDDAAPALLHLRLTRRAHARVVRTPVWVRAASAQRRPPSLLLFDHPAPALHAPSRSSPLLRGAFPDAAIASSPPSRSSPHSRRLRAHRPASGPPSRCSPHRRTLCARARRPVLALIAPSPLPPPSRLSPRARPRCPITLALALVTAPPPLPPRSPSSPRLRGPIGFASALALVAPPPRCSRHRHRARRPASALAAVPALPSSRCSPHPSLRAPSTLALVGPPPRCSRHRSRSSARLRLCLRARPRHPASMPPSPLPPRCSPHRRCLHPIALAAVPALPPSRPPPLPPFTPRVSVLPAFASDRRRRADGGVYGHAHTGVYLPTPLLD